MTAPFFWEGNASLINEDYHSIKGREGVKGFMILEGKLSGEREGWLSSEEAKIILRRKQ